MKIINAPWIESPFFEEIIKSKNLSANEEKIAREYHHNGFVVIPNLLPQSLIDSVREDAETRGFNPDFPITTQRDERRVQDFWTVSEPAKQLACYPELMAILEMLYGRSVQPFQTLHFSQGSQQRAHSDTIHFSSLPARYMCGVWVALEDITEENGPVFYYPGSQRLPEYDFSYIKDSAQVTSYEKDYKEYEDFIEKIVEVNKLEKKKFLAKKGDLLIWSSNIIHGGSPVAKEGLSRWSQVTHYFFENCYYYTPMLSNMATHEYFLRRRLVDIRTGNVMEQSYNGQKLPYMKTDKQLFSIFKKVPGILNYFKAMK